MVTTRSRRESSLFKMRFFPRILLILCAIAIGGCTTTGPRHAVHEELVTPYQLDSGDRVRIIVFGEADLSNTYIVDKAGFISMPLVGNITARGLTTAEIETGVAAKLRNGYLRNPDVSVEVDRYRPFFAMGEVNAAGQYP